MNVAWSTFGCPYCGIPSAIHEDVSTLRQFLAHGEIDLFCWLPEWELRWGRPWLLEVYAQHHDSHAVFPEPSHLVGLIHAGYAA